MQSAISLQLPAIISAPNPLEERVPMREAAPSRLWPCSSVEDMVVFNSCWENRTDLRFNGVLAVVHVVVELPAGGRSDSPPSVGDVVLALAGGRSISNSPPSVGDVVLALPGGRSELPPTVVGDPQPFLHSSSRLLSLLLGKVGGSLGVDVDDCFADDEYEAASKEL